MTLAQATGKIALYQSLVAGTLLLNLPIAYLFYRAGYPPETAFWISIALSLIAFVVRLLILNRIANFSIRQFITQVIIPVLLYAAPVGVVTVLLGDKFTTGFTRLFVLPLCSIALSCLCAFVFLLKREEKRLVVSKFLRFAKIDSQR